MTATEVKARRNPLPIRRPPEPSPSHRPWLTLAAVALAGYLLFVHGCHGDEDNELFARVRPSSAGAEVPRP